MADVNITVDENPVAEAEAVADEIVTDAVEVSSEIVDDAIEVADEVITEAEHDADIIRAHARLDGHEARITALEAHHIEAPAPPVIPVPVEVPAPEPPAAEEPPPPEEVINETAPEGEAGENEPVDEIAPKNRNKHWYFR